VERPSGARLLSNLPSRGITRLSTPPVTWENEMPLPTISNVWRVTINQQLGAINFCNVIHVIDNGSSDPEDVGDWIVDAWCATGSFRDIQTNKVNYLGIDVLSLDAPFGLTVNLTWTNANTTGLQNETPAPSNTAFINTLRTALGGRAHRGRMYIAGLSTESLTTESTRWDLADSVLNTAGETFRTGIVTISSANLGLCVASYELETAELVTSVVPRAYIGTQRRRAE
jgi:hypothetical protein